MSARPEDAEQTERRDETEATQPDSPANALDDVPGVAIGIVAGQAIAGDDETGADDDVDDDDDDVDDDDDDVDLDD